MQEGPATQVNSHLNKQSRYLSKAASPNDLQHSKVLYYCLVRVSESVTTECNRKPEPWQEAQVDKIIPFCSLQSQGRSGHRPPQAVSPLQRVVHQDQQVDVPHGHGPNTYETAIRERDAHVSRLIKEEGMCGFMGCQFGVT